MASNVLSKWLLMLLSYLVNYLEISQAHYNVAVIEMAVNLNFSQPASDILNANTNNYLQLIDDLAKNQLEVPLDLIVFPESTLTPYFSYEDTAAVLPQNTTIILCNSTSTSYMTFLKNLSCAAIEHNTTIVINFIEKEICEVQDEKCPKGQLFYNTNVVLGSNGSILARYRKWNLFGEMGKTKPTILDLPVLQLKNTTFGIMTCFDIQFGIPAFNLTKQKMVQNVIFPLNWISELPYLTALQTEQMWSQELNVVLLAAGSSLPQSGAGGSGIFFGSQGPLESHMLATRGTKTMVHSVPTNMNQNINVTNQEMTIEQIDALGASMDGFYMLIDPSIAEHNSIVLDPITQHNTTVCHGDGDNILCCSFNVSLSIVDHNISEAYTYHMVAFNGVRTYSKLYYGGVETCGIIACLNESISSCGQRFQNYSNINWPIQFNFISIRGNFSRTEQRIQFPSTLLSSIRPLPIQDYLWDTHEDNNTVLRQLSLQKVQTRLLTFGIFGRDFQRDWDPIRNNTNTEKSFANQLAISIWLINCATMLLLANSV